MRTGPPSLPPPARTEPYAASRFHFAEPDEVAVGPAAHDQVAEVVLGAQRGVGAQREFPLLRFDAARRQFDCDGCRYQFSDAFLRMLVKRLAVANTRISHLLKDNHDDQ